MKIHRYGIEFFDSSYPQFGGHSRWVAKALGWRLRYVRLDLVPFSVKWVKEYYDGYHRAIYAGFVCIGFGY